MSGAPSIDSLEASLFDLIEYRFPDALWVELAFHSKGVGTLWVLDVDNTYTEWLCSLSDDYRWTLSPRS